MPTRIAVIGHPSSGKTTIGMMLSCFDLDGCPVIHGDQYVLESTTDYRELASKLESENWIFEHISAAALACELVSRFDLLVALDIPIATLRSRWDNKGHHISEHESNALRQTLEQQISQAQDIGIEVCRASCIQDALKILIQRLLDSRLITHRLNSVVLKVASQCNLACPYCYMYKHHDSSWVGAQPFISSDVARSVGRRVREYVALTGQPMQIVLHGGEPTLLPISRFDSLLTEIKQELGDCASKVTFGMQTNGVALTNEYLRMADSHGISIGISIDGPEKRDNQERQFHSGRSAHEAIMTGLDKAKSFKWTKGAFSGVLAVINPDADGRRAYQQFTQLGLTAVDFLLRDQNWDSVPTTSAEKFLSDAFIAWSGDSKEIRVRTFATLLSGLLGVNAGSEAFGYRLLQTICINVDGSYELLDVLRASYPNAWGLPFNVIEHSLFDVTSSSEWGNHLQEKMILSDDCINCRYILVCGGGYMPHRYSRSKRYENRSVHCSAIKSLISQMERMRPPERRLTEFCCDCDAGA